MVAEGQEEEEQPEAEEKEAEAVEEAGEQVIWCKLAEQSSPKVWQPAQIQEDLGCMENEVAAAVVVAPELLCR